MTQVKVVEKVAASADKVFQLLGDFGGVKVGGPVESFEVKGEGVGAVRTIGFGGEKIVERQDRYEPEQRIMAYSITSEGGPLPVSDYSATITVIDDGDGSCTVDWTGNFEPRGVPEDQAKEIVKGIYTGGIQGARETLGV